jgi:SH3-like domain-containing protein
MKKIVFIFAILAVSCGSDEETIENIVATVEDSELGMNQDTTDAEEEGELMIMETVLFDEGVTLGAYVSDPGTEPTNVRMSPGGDVIIELQRVCEHQVTIVGVAHGWFKVNSIWGVDNEEETYENIEGYIHGSILAVDTRNYGGEEIYLLNAPDEHSEQLLVINHEMSFTLVDASKDGAWVKVRTRGAGEKKTGWIQRDWLCGSIVTLCS